MCGINMIFDKKGKADESAIIKMNKATAHRGPDSSSTSEIIFNKSIIYCGVSRLRIVDQDFHSDQPFSKEKDKLLLFNGEIYNHHELKNHLLRNGITFNTHSDTEVLYHHLSSFLEKGISDINGMFSFIYMDLAKGEILIARDRMGMKPLYYYEDEDFILISSEIRGLLASGLIDSGYDYNQTGNFLNYKYTRPTYTFYKDIRQFRQGRTYSLNQHGTLQEGIHFASKSVNTVKPDISGIIEDTENLITDSLVNHTTASVKIGLFLSGGVDSTLLLALAAKNQLPIAACYSIVNTETESAYGTNDFKYSRLAARQYHCNHDEMEINDEILHELPGFITNTDHPVADSAAFLTSILSRKAKKEVGIVLSGAGADELFGGYNRHEAYFHYLKNYDRYLKLGLPTKQIYNKLPGVFKLLGRKKNRLLDKFLSNIEKDPVQTFNNFRKLNILQNTSEKRNSDLKIENFIEDSLTSALESDRNEYLVEDVLTISDRMTMIHGLEMRMPYLDLEISKYIKELPAAFIMKNGPKWILKEILSRQGGEKYAIRSKEGFGFPFGLWIKRPKFEYLLNEIWFKENPIFNFIGEKELKEIINKHLNNKQDNSQEIWAILILSLWFRYKPQ